VGELTPHLLAGAQVGDFSGRNSCCRIIAFALSALLPHSFGLPERKRPGFDYLEEDTGP